MLTQSVVIWFKRHFTTFIQIWIFFFDVWALNCRQWVIDTPLHTMPFRTMGQVFGGVMCPLLLLRAGPFLSHELAPVGELAIYVWPRGHAKRLHLHLKGVDWHSDDTSSQKKKKKTSNCNWPHLHSGPNSLMATIQKEKWSIGVYDAFHHSQSSREWGVTRLWIWQEDTSNAGYWQWLNFWQLVRKL